MQTNAKKVFYCENSIGFLLTTDEEEAKRENPDYDLAIIEDLEDYIGMIGEQGIFREPVQVKSGVYLWNEDLMEYIKQK
jgi:hypothetical protein